MMEHSVEFPISRHLTEHERRSITAMGLSTLSMRMETDWTVEAGEVLSKACRYVPSSFFLYTSSSSMVDPSTLALRCLWSICKLA